MPETTLTFPIRSDKLTMSVRVSEMLCQVKTEFQTVEILQTDALGRMLFLDGHVQLAEIDEYAYHEALVHIPLLGVAQPKRALVVGGGDGGVLRELCKHASIEQIDMVEIDAGVVAACREHLPGVSNGAFNDPRVNLVIGDAFAFVKQGELAPYDLIVVDATDVYEEEDGELSEMLFTDEFYKDCLRLLSDEGFVVTQADNLLFCPYSLEEISANFGRVFPEVGSYWALVPSFGGYSGYCWASKRRLDPIWREIPGLRYLSPRTLEMAVNPLPISTMSK
jgi:spermidine synthase